MDRRAFLHRRAMAVAGSAAGIVGYTLGIEPHWLAAGSLMRASALPPELEAHPDKVTDPEQWFMRGGSAIIGTDGSYIAEPVYEMPASLVTDLELDRVREHLIRG